MQADLPDPSGGPMRRTSDLPLALALVLLGACAPDGPSTAPDQSVPSFIIGPGHVTVNSLADPGDGTCDAANCTLREAIDDPSVTEIVFPKGLSGVITLDGSRGTLLVDRPLSIVGPTKRVTVQRRLDDPVAFPVFRFDENAVATLKNLTIQGGEAVAIGANTVNKGGGGIRNLGRLTLIQCLVVGNTAPPVGTANGFGGGIFSQGLFGSPASLSLVQTTVSDNSATPNSGGGVSADNVVLDRSTVSGNAGVGIEGRNFTITGSTVSGNSGFGIVGSGTISGTTVSGNTGGGVVLNGVVGAWAISNSLVADNGGIGVAVVWRDDESGLADITNTTIRGNSNTGPGVDVDGGGLVTIGDGHLAVTLTQSTISGNSAEYGGGVHAGYNTQTNLVNSTVSGNSAAKGGGGILAQGSVELVSTTLANNVSTAGAGGGLDVAPNSGTVRLVNSTVSGNSAANGGGGIVAQGSLELVGTTVANNVSTGGAGGGLGVLAGGTTRLTNSTVSGNSAANGGGGIVAEGSLELVNTTLGNNVSIGGAGGGLDVLAGGTTRLTNSLIALNRAPSGPDLANAGGALEASYSLVGIGDGSGLADGVTGNRIGSAGAPLDPQLGPLANNGGLTLTQALKAGSPALDAASTPLCPTGDQRGVVRPQGPACDMGSYERTVNKK
jgi:CSLREA domain-containing protein